MASWFHHSCLPSAGVAVSNFPNVGVEVEGYVGKLGQFQRMGYYENIVYHKNKRIRVNLYCAWYEDYDEPDRRFFNSDNHMLLVSNQACNLLLLYSLTLVN